VAKEVGDLTRIFCAALEEHHGKPVPALNRFLGPEASGRKIPGSTDFVVERSASPSPTTGIRARPGQPGPRLPSR
jgi:hypothetical protein